MATSGTWEISWASGTWSGYPKAYHWAGSFSRSGNTISLSNMRLWFTVSGSSASAYGITDSVTVTGGSAQTVTWNFSGSTTSNIVWLNNTSFSVGTSATSANIQCAIAGEVTGSTTIYFDPAYVAPATPTISATASGPDTISVTYGTTSFGNPPSGTVTLYGGTATAPTTQIASKTTTGNSVFNYTGLTNNTKYYFRSRANNGQLNSSYSTEISAVTLPAALTASSAVATSDTTIDISYTTAAGGTAYDKDIQYSLDNSTWTTGATVSAGAATSGTFTISGLIPNTTYTIYLRVNTTSGYTLSGNVTATTMSAYKLYGPVNGQTKLITKLYGSVNGQTKEIKKLYGSVNGVTKRIF